MPMTFTCALFSLKYINIAMVTILKNVTNILTAIGELYIFGKRQNQKVWTAMFVMVCLCHSSIKCIFSSQGGHILKENGHCNSYVVYPVFIVHVRSWKNLVL